VSGNIPPERRHPQSLDAIGAGDTLKITFMGAQDQNQVVKIPPDGRLSLPYIKGDVNAIDKSAAALQKILFENCTELTNKTVIVTLQESAKRVYVTGALKVAIPLEHPMTVSQVVAAAGGAPEESLDKPVILTCIENGKTVSYSIRLRDPAPVYVKPGDEIRVAPVETF
jgi:protein involved in polysaccharide export with SLBB domain